MSPRNVDRTFTETSGGVGHPDFGQPLPKGQAPVGPIYTLTDLGELAARQGSIVTFDRRGYVVWLDDFEDNINKWFQEVVGAGGSIALSTDAARNGANSAKLVTPSATTTYAAISRAMGLRQPSREGFEISFADLEDDTYFQIGIVYYDGTNSYAGYIRYDPDDDTLQVYDATAGWVTIGSSINIYTDVSAWQTMKLVANLSTQAYVRAILNDTEYDLSSYSMFSATTSVAPRIAVGAWIYREVASNLHVYVDDAIVTQQEPAND